MLNKSNKSIFFVKRNTFSLIQHILQLIYGRKLHNRAARKSLGLKPTQLPTSSVFNWYASDCVDLSYRTYHQTTKTNEYDKRYQLLQGNAMYVLTF